MGRILKSGGLILLAIILIVFLGSWFILGFRVDDYKAIVSGVFGGVTQVVPGQVQPSQGHVGFGGGAAQPSGEAAAQPQPSTQQPSAAAAQQPSLGPAEFEALDQVQKYADLAKLPYDRLAQSGMGQAVRGITAETLPISERIRKGGFSLRDIFNLIVALLVFGVVIGVLARPLRSVLKSSYNTLIAPIVNFFWGLLKPVVTLFLGRNLVSVFFRLLGLTLAGGAGWLMAKSPLYEPAPLIATFVSGGFVVIALILSALFSRLSEVLIRRAGDLGGGLVWLVIVFVLVNAAIVLSGGLYSAYTRQPFDPEILRFAVLVRPAQFWQVFTDDYNWMVIMAMLGSFLLVLGPLFANVFEERSGPRSGYSSSQSPRRHLRMTPEEEEG